MMVSVETYLRRGQRQLRQWSAVPGVRPVLQVLGYGGGGFLLSAASLGNAPLPLAMGLSCAVSGWRAVVVSLGSMLGYRVFWQEQGLQGMIWAALGGLLGLLLRKQRSIRDMPLLIPSLVSFLVSALGLTFQVLWLDEVSFGIYALRVLLAGGSAMLFERRIRQNDPLSRLLCNGVIMLALAQVAPLPWLNLGYVACGIFAASQSFPSAVLAGLGLDLAQVSAIPMTGVVCLSCFLRLILPGSPTFRLIGPCGIYLGIMLLGGSWDLSPIPGLLLGSAIGMVLPVRSRPSPAQGHTGHAQVQLELTAGILADTQQLLLETPTAPIDEEALLEKVRLRACVSCPSQKDCREQEHLAIHHLHQPMDFACRKSSRILGELRRGREQLILLRREKQRQQEYRWALIQQYQFLSENLRSLSDSLQNRQRPLHPRYRIQVSARSRSKELSNGDQCMAFPGPQCRYYVSLCDGMGTGLGAAQEGESAALLLKKMLTAGFSAEQAFRSINSILVLRGQAGAVTLDLVEVGLDTGRATLYKWGAAPSWLLSHRGMEKIGTATPPPGIAIEKGQEAVISLSLHRGETLILLSDGAEIQEAAFRGKISEDMPPGELAAAIVKLSRTKGEDDATAAVLRLEPLQTEDNSPQAVKQIGV